MLPKLDTKNIKNEKSFRPSKTYRIDPIAKRITNSINDLTAIEQYVTKLLVTERQAYEIYSSRYGTELHKYIGADYDFIISDLERNFKETLKLDDRILEIEEFEVERLGLDSLYIQMKISTIFGELEVNTEMEI